MRALGYSIEQALLSAWRGRSSTLLPVLTIALALFVLGAFLLLMLNVRRLVVSWERTAELSVYLSDQITPDQQTAIEEAIASSPLVAGREYVSKDQARRRFAGLFPDLAGLASTDGANPFPASFEVQLRPGHEADAAISAWAGTLRQMPGVADTRYDRQWLAQLVRAAEVAGGIGLLLASVLSMAGALTVASVVRLALAARRDEVEIMRLVGAPFAYIRGPFITEGLLHGGVGALLAVVFLVGAVGFARARYAAAALSLLGVSPVWFPPLELCGLLVVGGMAVGGLGGVVAAWNGRSEAAFRD